MMRKLYLTSAVRSTRITGTRSSTERTSEWTRSTTDVTCWARAAATDDTCHKSCIAIKRFVNENKPTVAYSIRRKGMLTVADSWDPLFPEKWTLMYILVYPHSHISRTQDYFEEAEPAQQILNWTFGVQKIFWLIQWRIHIFWKGEGYIFSACWRVKRSIFRSYIEIIFWCVFVQVVFCWGS